MKKSEISKLEKLGGLVLLDSGEKGVRVFLQYRPRLTEKSRQARKQQLQEQFHAIEPDLRASGGSLDLEHLSVSGQVAEATLPVTRLDEISEKLKKKEFQVELLRDMQVV